MEQSMQAKCKADGVFDLVFLNNPPATDNTKVFANFFFDGDRFQKPHTEKDPKQKHVIYVQLYEDAMGKTTSRLGDMDLIAIVNSMYLKNAAGVEKVLECVVQEIIEFETTGIEVGVSGIGVLCVYGRLVHFTTWQSIKCLVLLKDLAVITVTPSVTPLERYADVN
ncbi:hypothetical protein DAPPUDRAFT_335510 [Daphnia pulex]|uniref:Uncharacterized protein n=1 Tax=Daphnia pulex TaxID=6669 RepID=E9HXX8_DAPPU|nr:hypothetical protein DAPPUDRAFT_335510 [Daphnia pulex]|eukprot:EFX63403.1 hypothetical protein DAPPUDRAFT_335510 [Daphnia pulex]